MGLRGNGEGRAVWQALRADFTLDCPAAEVIQAVMIWAPKTERLAINERIADAPVRIRGEQQAASWGRPSLGSGAQVSRCAARRQI